MVDINGYDFQQKYWISPEAHYELYFWLIWNNWSLEDFMKKIVNKKLSIVSD